MTDGRTGETMLLETRRLSKSFGSLKAADGIDLAVAAGEAVGIIGPNGAGKSTLFNLIAGSVAADGGAVLLEGRDITRLPAHRRCHAGIGRSYQIPLPFESLTVFENLLVAAVHGRGRSVKGATDVCAGILERTGLMRRANVAAGSLTLLERKRLEMARALATGPRAAAARRDRRRAHRERVSRAGRHHQGHPRPWHHHRVDRAHRACAAGGGRPAGRAQLRPQDRGRGAARRDGLPAGAGDLHGVGGMRRVGWVKRSADPTPVDFASCVGSSLTLDPTYAYAASAESGA